MHDTSPYSTGTETDILLVEDDPDDVRLTREAFRSTERAVTLRAIANGDDAVEFLQESPDDDLPDIILLDLNLPGRDGREVLEVIRDDPRLKPLPVVILASSEAEADVARCYDAGANAYLTKPTDPVEFNALLEVFADFWIGKVRSPSISA